MNAPNGSEGTRDALPSASPVPERSSQEPAPLESENGQRLAGRACSQYFVPFGPEWESEIMKMRKADMVTMFRKTCISLQETKEELQTWRDGGLTEEILRRNDGYIKVGKGCVIALASDIPANVGAQPPRSGPQLSNRCEQEDNRS